MKNKVVSSVERVTPKKAATWLTHNDINRALKPGLVSKYAWELRNDDWTLNGQSIVLADDGTLLDGQHRLTACVEAGIPFHAVVVKGVDKAVFDTIDTGMARSAADVLTAEGFSPREARALAAAGRLCVIFEASLGRTLNHAGIDASKLAAAATPGRVADFVLEHLELQTLGRAVLDYPSTSLPMANSKILFVWFYANRVADESDVYEFFHSFITGANLDEHSPQLELRRRLEVQRSSTFKWTSIQQVQALIKTLTWFLEGRRITSKHSRSNMLKPSKLPPSLEVLRPGLVQKHPDLEADDGE